MRIGKLDITITRVKPTLRNPCSACGQPSNLWPLGCLPDDRYLRVAEDPRPPRPQGYLDAPIGWECTSCLARPANYHHVGCDQRVRRP